MPRVSAYFRGLSQIILMYHKVIPKIESMWWVIFDKFRQQMDELKDKEVVYLNHYDPTNNKQAITTFD